jgi:2-amino-4-hydroxy-6-hydroxymethyldihydropteridine diphosphokinase
MRRRFGTLVLSPVYETEAQGFEGPPFLNLVAAFDTGLSVDEVKDALHEIERGRGRLRAVKRNESRALDLDVILYGDHDFHDLGVDVPRREIREYAFVLKPLCDLFPDGVHPATGESFCDLWRSLSRTGQGLRRLDDFDFTGSDR